MPLKTQGEIEAAICEGITRFEQDYMGRGPKDIHAFLLGDLVVVRLKGVLTAAEQQLVKSLPAEKGRDLLKQVRSHLIETARPVMEAMVEKVTGVKVVSLHHDISTTTGEEVVLFSLAQPCLVRELKRAATFESRKNSALLGYAVTTRGWANFIYDSTSSAKRTHPCRRHAASASRFLDPMIRAMPGL